MKHPSRIITADRIPKRQNCAFDILSFVIVRVRPRRICQQRLNFAQMFENNERMRQVSTVSSTFEHVDIF